MSVPSHTRNQLHISSDYEAYLLDNYTKITGANLSGIPHPGDVNNMNTLFVSLARYTNANFFSEKTIFSLDFPNPAKGSTDAALIEVIAADGAKDMTYRIVRTDPDNSTKQYKVAAYSYLKKFLVAGIFIPTYEWGYILNDDVYSDYADRLIPRAILYSTDMLNLFFRGKIDLKRDKDNPGKYVLLNNSENNLALSGTFSLYYDDVNDKRTLITSWSNIIIPAGAKSVPVSFTVPTNPEPKVKGTYMLVFDSGVNSAERGRRRQGGLLGGKLGGTLERVVYLPWANLL